ncbi:hypothetical protein [Metallosphaera hakonensis]|uniref:hypothetical protein n=1 Tax=Metallosphaera hakonensis TaxID=79601 RepID=UPI000A8ABEEA|nr:hypothetical protein [Metallosphaera hakonensis]
MRPVLVGLVNLSARILSLPLSLTFLYLVSSVPQEDYARWTFLSAGILGLMSIPLGSVSGLISRYSAEGKPVGYAVILETVLLSLELPLLWLLDLSLELRLLSSIYLVSSRSTLS